MIAQVNHPLNTFLYFPNSKPHPWPSTVVCARLLRSGDILKKEWWADMSRATGGRLRPFALAVVDSSECQAEFGLFAIGASTAAALLATTMTVRAVLGRNS